MKKRNVIVILVVLVILVFLVYLWMRSHKNVNFLNNLVQPNNQEQRNDPVPPDHIDDSMKMVFDLPSFVADESLPVEIPDGWITYSENGLSFAYPSEYTVTPTPDGMGIQIAPQANSTPRQNCDSEKTFEAFVICSNPPQSPYITLFIDKNPAGVTIPYEKVFKDKESLGAYSYAHWTDDMVTETFKEYYAIYKDDVFYRFNFLAYDTPYNKKTIQDLKQLFGDDYTMSREDQNKLLREILKTFRIQ